MSKLARTLAFAALAAVLLAPWLPAAADEKTKEKPKPKPLPIWVIEGDTPNYLIGTVRVPDKRTTVIAGTLQKVVEAGDVFVGEVPMDMASQLKVQAAAVIPGGKTLPQVIGDELYARMRALLPPGVPDVIFRQFSPFAVLSFVQMGKYMVSMVRGEQPLDLVIRQKFVAAKKGVDALAPIEAQAALLKQFTLEEQVEMLRATIVRLEKEKEKGIDGIARMVDWYLKGELDKVYKWASSEMTSDEKLNAKFMKLAMHDQNAKLATALVEKIKKAPDKVHLIVLDVNRYADTKGILALLKAKGHSIRQLKEGDALPAQKEPAGATK